MKRSLRLLLPLLIVSLWLLSTPGVGYAFPPLPSSFYGTVKLNAANLPDGTRIEALINDQVYAYSQTQTYQGGSVYSLDIPGDDTSTPAVVEGGVEGDTIQFRVGGILASQTAVWHSATNVELNLSASSANTPLPPQPTPTPLPTQTSISLPPTQRPPTRTQAAVAPTQTSIAITQAVISSTRTSVSGSTATPALAVSTESQAQTGAPQAATSTPAGSAPSTSEPSQGEPSSGASPVVSPAAITTEVIVTKAASSSPPASNNSGLFYWITVPTFIGTFALILLIMAGLIWFLLKKK